ncbi:MAG: hypothetical protein KAT75_10345 [Dehalococcoidia bacterium]|nr:hypothetical protein [Dehalococcoidia bacterium]
MKEVVWVSGVVGSYEKAEAVLQRVGHLSISDNSVWRRVQEWGEKFKEAEDTGRERANALPGLNDMYRGVSETDERMGVSMDGGMVHIRDEGWKELKVGCVFELEVRPMWDKKTKERVELAHAVGNSYVAHLGGPELFGQMVWAEAQARGWEQAMDTQVVGDGAPWIWNLAGEHFYDSRQVVDWYHATEHLGVAAKLLHGEGSAAAKRWYKRAETTLYQGHAERIAVELSEAAENQSEVADGLLTQAGYFSKNKRRMQYLEMREEEYVIGSGMVESGCKQFKARLCGPGMRWSRPGIERLIPIRGAIMSNRFDTMWQQVYCNSPPN